MMLFTAVTLQWWYNQHIKFLKSKFLVVDSTPGKYNFLSLFFFFFEVFPKEPISGCGDYGFELDFSGYLTWHEPTS